MKPEEAINYLQDPIGKREKHDEAIQMAIEALKAQLSSCSEIPNSSDLISRQAAIDAFMKVTSDGDKAEWCKWVLEQLPSVQPEQRWIPCSERLPENDERVLATTAWGDVTIAERIYPPINDTCWFIHDGNTNATIDDVVAWMPLQESYKGE